MMKALLTRLDDVIMPRYCVFCGDQCRQGEGTLCTGCRSDLPRNPNMAPLPPCDTVVAPLAYAFPVDSALKALKFNRKLYFVPPFSGLLQEAAASLPADVDALLPVPLHWIRHSTRGFNQSAELCKPLAKSMGLPLLDAVSRRRATRSQSGLSAKERRRNLRNAFRLRRPVEAQHVCLVDDVVTTGATVRAVARLLLDSGVDRVSVLAVARA